MLPLPAQKLVNAVKKTGKSLHNNKYQGWRACVAALIKFQSNEVLVELEFAI